MGLTLLLVDDTLARMVVGDVAAVLLLVGERLSADLAGVSLLVGRLVLLRGLCFLPPLFGQYVICLLKSKYVAQKIYQKRGEFSTKEEHGKATANTLEIQAMSKIYLESTYLDFFILVCLAVRRFQSVVL